MIFVVYFFFVWHCSVPTTSLILGQCATAPSSIPSPTLSWPSTCKQYRWQDAKTQVILIRIGGLLGLHHGSPHLLAGVGALGKDLGVLIHKEGVVHLVRCILGRFLLVEVVYTRLDPTTYRGIQN